MSSTSVVEARGDEGAMGAVITAVRSSCSAMVRGRCCRVPLGWGQLPDSSLSGGFPLTFEKTCWDPAFPGPPLAVRGVEG